MTRAELQEKYGNPILSDSTRAMFHDAENRQVWIHVKSRRDSYVINPPIFLAIDAYKNPLLYAEASLQGIENPRRLVPVGMRNAA